MAIARQAKDVTPETWRNVRRCFIEANRLDSEDPEPLLLFYSTFAAQGERPTDNAIAGLHPALDLAPQDRSLRMVGAYEHLYAGDHRDARRLLTLVASDPHDAENAQRATRLIRILDEDGIEAALAAFGGDAGSQQTGP